MGTSQAFGATAKAGGACTKVGLKSGSLICTEVSGKLKWQIIKRAQAIRFSAPVQASTADSPVRFTFSASSKLAVKASALTPDICTLGNSSILLSGTPGLCSVSLQQNGNLYFSPAKRLVVEIQIHGSNVIDFHLPGALLISQVAYQLSATSSSNLAVTFTSSTPAVCTVQSSTLILLQVGTCTVIASQAGSDLVSAAESVTQSVEISADRVSADLPDTFPGFQVKAVYVVPSDGTDNSYDTNGYLAGILDEGNAYLLGQVGYSVPIDRNATGYDIQFLKSKYTTEYLSTHENPSVASTSDQSVLLTEIRAMESPGDNRKDYIFFIEVPGFEGKYCGFADTPGIAAIVALEDVSNSGTCRGPSAIPFLNYTSKTWVHELMHNFGVGHTPNDPCDLMFGGDTSAQCTAPEGITVDKERTRYVGTSSTQGPNILSLRVWQGHTSDAGLTANCIINPVARLDGTQYAYCPTGTRNIGELQSCWISVSSVSLEELIAGVWVDLGAGSYSTKFWGGDLPQYTCLDPTHHQYTVWKNITVDTPGIRHYRWIVNGAVNESLNVIWVQ